MSTQLFAILASAGLATAGLAAASATRSADALPTGAVALAADDQGGGNRCRVEILRTGPGGTAATVRRELEGGECLCSMTTGPEGNNGSAENLVLALLRDRTCEGAPPAAVDGGANGGLLGGLIGAAALGGLAAGLGGKSNG